MMIVLPMFHTNPLCVWTYPLSYAGQTLCIRKAFSPTDFWSAIVENEVTVLMAVPTMYDYVYNSIDPSTVDIPNLKLKWSFSGAAPLPVDLIRGFKEKYNVDIIEGYADRSYRSLHLQSAIGIQKIRFHRSPIIRARKLPYVDDHNILRLAEKAKSAFARCQHAVYLNKPEATAETIRDGWLHTGDMGYMDEDGFFYISGRKKEMIIRGGENIYPREIEIPLEKHPKIAEVAVIGAPDPALGERVRACIVLFEPGSMTAAE